MFLIFLKEGIIMKLEHPGLLAMPSDDYHANQSLGHSALLKLLRSPAHYREYVTTTHEPTAAMAFGTALHAAVLEPDVFGSEYAVFDETLLDGALQTIDDYKVAAEALAVKVGKMRKDEIKAAIKAADVESRFKFREDEIARLYGGKTILSAEQMTAIQSIQVNISKHAGAARRLANGASEMSGFWVDSETGVQCKIRPDWLAMDEAGEIVAILDVKTTKDSSIGGFGKSVANLGYDVQAAYYTDGLREIIGKEVPFLFLAVESDSPHNVALYRADPEMLEVGRKKYRAGLMLMKWCQESGQWPGYQPGGEEELISLPAWAVKGAASYDME
jgi:hypothetical protein